jgi:hypothetical protein
MQTISERAKEHFPSVLLTLLSIIQALALELLWNRVHAHDYFWDGGMTAVVGWTQAAVLLLGVFQVWLFYTSIVLRFRWVPAVQDSVLPFAIGILEFSLVDLMGPDTLPLWLVAFALIFAVSIFASQSVFRRARLDPDNQAFFDATPPVGRRDLVQPVAAVAGLLLLALIVWINGGWGWVSLIALLATGGALAHQAEIVRRFWNQSISLEADTKAPE